MPRHFRTPLGRLADNASEYHAHQVLKFLFDSQFTPSGDPDTPASLCIISRAIGLSCSRTRDACDFLVRRRLAVRKGNIRRFIYSITLDGIVYVDSTSPDVGQDPRKGSEGNEGK
ncbi:MAG: hypothetical protein NTX53_21830 [candidate division WOR-3 bacterium]|nr:hypothetical protein [candidate division WOR-3 bacterium]